MTDDTTDRIGLIERYYREVLEGGNLSLMDEMTADDYVNHEDAPILGQPAGKEGALHFVKALRTAFPDVHVKAMGPVLSGDNMEAGHVVLAGTHNGEISGIKPTGRSVEFDATDIVRVENGQVAEHWGTTDHLRLMRQLGVVALRRGT